MSVEFVCVVGTEKDWRGAFLDAIRSNPSYQLLSSCDDDQLLLRIAKNPPRSNWPEDVTLLFRTGQICVQFHSADRSDRTTLIALLETTLAHFGSAARFTEE